MIDTSTPFDEYVSWYSWAWINLVREVVVCHTAAAAAMQALAAGGDRDAAAAAARRAAGDNAVVGRTRAGYGHRHRYVEWFIWARANLGLPDARCHQAADAAVRCIAAGGSQQSASETAVRVSCGRRPHVGVMPMPAAVKQPSEVRRRPRTKWF